MIVPVNLLDELDELSSGAYVRRVMARTLMHSGLSLADARDVWVTTGLGAELWGQYAPVIHPA